MKKLLFIIFLAFPCLMLAQSESMQQTVSVRFGVINYDSVFRSMPDYAVAQRQIALLHEKYNAESKRAEDEFNAKYEEFLEGQHDFPPTILKKRQTELQELMNKNIAFKEESRRLLKEAEKDIYKPLHEKLAGILSKIGAENSLSFILNKDGNACPYINPAQGIDVTQLAIGYLK